MSLVIDCLREEHKAISRVLFQLLPLVQQVSSSPQQKVLIVNQLKEKLMQLDVLIGGAHHWVEEVMMQRLAQKSLAQASQQLVNNMLADHEMLDVFSELLMLRISEYLADDNKKAALIRAVNQYVKQHIQHINREQMQLFKLCEDNLDAEDWQMLNAIYPVAQSNGPSLKAVS